MQEKERKPTILGPDSLRLGGGSSNVKGWGPKSSVCPSKPKETKLFGGISHEFCWDISKVPEILEKMSLDQVVANYFVRFGSACLKKVSFLPNF